MAFLQQGTMSDPASTSSPTPSTSESQSFFSPRSQKQLGLFAAGAGFFALSALITRRSLVKRYKMSIPKFYNPSNGIKGNEVNGAMEAFEALNIATINVASVAMLCTGGMLWAFDISSVDDLRRDLRKRLGVDQNRTDQDVEEEIEEWFATVLERKDKKDIKSVENVSVILEKVAEKERLAKEARAAEGKS